MRQFTLISFDLCPFVQRSIITLKRKGIRFKICFIDLANKPDWFLKLSPTGKVPLLIVKQSGQPDEIVFESAVINEYLDEVNPPALMPADALVRAKHRAFIEFTSQLLVIQYKLTHAKSAEDKATHTNELKKQLARLMNEVKLPLFAGANFSLIDAAIAPLIMRQRLIDREWNLDVIASNETCRKYAKNLLQRPAVRGSVIHGFAEKYIASIRQSGGF